MRIAYVVLHYQTIEETKQCVESILKVLSPEDCIVVVDNGSPNGSGIKIKELFGKVDQVEVIISEKNLGFAKGNNIGYFYAKYTHKADIIILLNNDTIIGQDDFRQKLISDYQKYKFDIAGPKILQRDGSVNTSSPCKPVHTTYIRAKVGQIINIVRLAISYLDLDLLFERIENSGKSGSNCCIEYSEDVQISGSCIILAPNYIKMFEGLNPDTFMYLEEIILYVRAQKYHLRIAYDPSIEIIHLEDAATNAIYSGKMRAKRQFKYKCQRQSFRVLLSELQ